MRKDVQYLVFSTDSVLLFQQALYADGVVMLVRQCDLEHLKGLCRVSGMLMAEAALYCCAAHDMSQQ